MKLKEFRLKYKLTRKELAYILGVAPNTIAIWERGGPIRGIRPERFMQALEARDAEVFIEKMRGKMGAIENPKANYIRLPLPPQNIF